MIRKRLVRTLCAALVMTAMLIALVLVAGVGLGGWLPSGQQPSAGGFVPYPSGRDPVDLSPFLGTKPVSDRETTPETETETESEPETTPEGLMFYINGSADEKVYLKEQSYGNYDGQSWGDAPMYSECIDDIYSADYLPGYGAADPFKHVTVTPVVPISLLPYYLCDNIGAPIQSNDAVASMPADEQYTLYYNEGVPLSNADSVKWIRFEKRYAAYVREQYLYVDDATALYMKDLITRKDFAAIQDQDELIEAVADYIRYAADYDLKYDPALDQEDNVVIAFLEDYRRGVCRHYASAATLLFRSLGVPARYVSGYAPRMRAGEEIPVYAEQGHAWVEVYIDSFGWRPVEVTPSDEDNMGTVYLWATATSIRYDSDRTEPYVAHVEISGLPDGYTASYDMEGARTEPGFGACIIDPLSVKIHSVGGDDVTGRFTIRVNQMPKGNGSVETIGSIHVYLAALVVRTDRDPVSGAELGVYRVTYNGEHHQLPNAYYKGAYSIEDSHLANSAYMSAEDFDALMADYEISVKADRIERVNVGVYAASMSVVVRNRQTRRECTEYFKITRINGVIEIEHAPLTVRAENQVVTVPFADVNAMPAIDKTAYVYDPTALMPGHRFESLELLCDYRRGNATTPISVDPETIRIVDEEGNDVTSNYRIQIESGLLTVRFTV